jgi:hypothetical protein
MKLMRGSQCIFNRSTVRSIEYRDKSQSARESLCLHGFHTEVTLRFETGLDRGIIFFENRTVPGTG